MYSTMTSRIKHDIENLSVRGNRSISKRTNPLHYDIYFNGPIGSRYYCNVFHILVDFTGNYPFSPPVVTFLQDIDIPEVDALTGKLRMKILDPRIWNSTSGLQDVMTCLYYVLRTQLPAEIEDEE